tara:strand:+ start:56 stop:622 length:567 start_codon:yes stop_codon:yes gene_type:complete
MKKVLMNRRKSALERQKKMIPTLKGIKKTLPLVKNLKKMKTKKNNIKGVVSKIEYVKAIKKTPRIEKKNYYPYIKIVLEQIKDKVEDYKNYSEVDGTYYHPTEKLTKTQKRQLKGTRKTSTLKELKEAVIQKYNLFDELDDYTGMINESMEKEIFMPYRNWELNILGEKRFKFKDDNNKMRKYLVIKK